ncbi:MAG: ABC transporter ATP-binding protein [Acidobacteriia bacterium]|nr:ABC transporter ATP-binding protein [Methyloceanibacter sp.]MCL6492248.1 ABC transporter ATP-binding protein [Terriglobia bacterium]
MTEVLACEGLKAGYGGREVLSGVSMRLAAGEVLCLVGHNGAGKSTLLKVLFGLHRPSAGSIRLDGAVVRPEPERMAKAGITYLPEGRGVFPTLSVRENFALGLFSLGLKGAAAQERIAEVLSLLPQLRPLWQRRAATLSGGQQQMVSIGRALLSRPRILLMDEPSIGLAPKLFQDLLAPVRALQRQRGMAILLVEQNIAEAFAMADRSMVMRSGRIIFEGPPSALSDKTRLLELF